MSDSPSLSLSLLQWFLGEDESAVGILEEGGGWVVSRGEGGSSGRGK